MLDAELCVSVKVESCFFCFLLLIYVAPTLDMLYLILYSLGIVIFGDKKWRKHVSSVLKFVVFGLVVTF